MAVDTSILLPEYTSGVHPVIAQSNISTRMRLLGNTANMDYLDRYATTQLYLYDRSETTVSRTSYDPRTDKPTAYASTRVNYPNIVSSYEFAGACAVSHCGVVLYEDTNTTGIRIWFEDAEAGDVYTYVTNYCSLWSRTLDTSCYTVAGIIKHTAVVPGLTVSDVMLGVIIDNGTGHFIVNGVSQYTYSSGTGHNMEFIGIEIDNVADPVSYERDWETCPVLANNPSGNTDYIEYAYNAQNVDFIFYTESCAGGFDVAIGSAFAVAGTAAAPPSRWRNFNRSAEVNLP